MTFRATIRGMRAWMLVIAGAVACGGAAPKATKPVEPADAPSDAAADVRGVVQEAYGSLGHGSCEGILPLMADHVYAIGPAGGEAIAARSDVVVALGAAFPPEKKHRMNSHALRAVVSPGGASAYVWDQLDIDGAPYVATAVMEQQGGMWVAVAVEVAKPGGGAKGAHGAAPSPSPSSSSSSDVDASAKAAVALFTQGAAAPERFLDQLADGPEVVALGPGAKDVIKGGAAIHKAWKKALKKKPTLTITGGVRAGATPDGQLVWIHADVMRGSEGGGEPAPRRIFYVYTRDGAGWRLSVAHESAVTK